MTGPSTILRMATMNAAKALGFSGQLGELSPNAEADLIAIPFTGSLRNAASAAVHFQEHVTASMIRGKWVLGPAAGSAKIQ